MSGHEQVVAALERQVWDLRRVIARMESALLLVPQPTSSWAGLARTSFDACALALRRQLELAIVAAADAEFETSRTLRSWVQHG